MAKITFGYVSKANPFIDRKAWSGTIFKIRESIEQAGYTVRWICLLYTSDAADE